MKVTPQTELALDSVVSEPPSHRESGDNVAPSVDVELYAVKNSIVSNSAMASSKVLRGES